MTHSLGYLRPAALLFVPLLALAAWMCVAPTYRLCQEEDGYNLPFLIYDKYDLTAMAMRGLNAELGRQPGAEFNPPGEDPRDFEKRLHAPHTQKERYFLEYPHAMLLLFRAGFWIQPGWREAPIPEYLPDSDYHNLCEYHPESDPDLRLCRVFVIATHFYVVVMVVCLLILIYLCERGYSAASGLRGGALIFLLPGMLFFTLNRFDVIPAMLTALSMACLSRNRPLTAGGVLALATLVKVYPILFVPLVMRYLWQFRSERSLPPDDAPLHQWLIALCAQRRAMILFLAAYGVVGLLAFTPLLFGADWAAVVAPYRYQLSRPPEFGLIIHGKLLPVWDNDDPQQRRNAMLLRFGVMGVTMLFLLDFPIRDMHSLLRRCAIILIVFVSLAVFYSPQWILWLGGLVAPLLGRNPRVAYTLIVFDAITYLTFPFWFFVNGPLIVSVFGNFNEFDKVAYYQLQVLLYCRFACSAFFLGQLIWLEWRSRRPAEPPPTTETAPIPQELSLKPAT